MFPTGAVGAVHGRLGYDVGKLTARQVRTAKGPAKLMDQHGLYLRVTKRGMKTWVQRLNI